MARSVTGPIESGAPIAARDIQTIQRTSDQAANVVGSQGLNFTRNPSGVSASLGRVPQDLKTYSILQAVNEGAAIIQPREVAVITGSLYDSLNHPFQQWRNPCLRVRHATAAADDDLHWGVAVDAIPVGQMGRFCVGGVTMALVIGVAGTDEDNWQVTNDYASSGLYLRITTAGQGQILWRDSVNYAIDVAHPALVRFPSGGGGSGVYIVANFAALPAAATVGDGALGYTEDKDNFYGVRVGAWRILHPFTQTTAPSSIGEADGDLWYDTDTSPYSVYARRNGAWVAISDFAIYTATVKGSLPSVSDPALGYATTPDVLYARCGSSWLSISHSE